MLGPTTFFAFRDLFPVDREARNQARDARADVAELGARVDRLSLITMALWSLVRDQLGLTEEQLAQRVQDLDLSDGKLDGKINPQATKCPKCGKMVSPRHARCWYCGRVRDQVSIA